MAGVEVGWLGGGELVLMRGNHHGETGERRLPALDHADSSPTRTFAGNATLEWDAVLSSVR